MLQSFQEFINKNNLCRRGEGILIAVSGGLDSVVLLDLFSKTGYKIALAHCNFKLRGDESDEDEQFVRTLAKKYSVELFVKTCPAKEYATRNGLSIQEAARDLRYTFFEDIIAEKNFDKVAVAHHADDNLETFFINFMRGSGLQGIKGIPVERENIIRPLMFATRFQIEQYAAKNNLTWRNDSSNNSLKYLRNKIRHRLLPELKKISPDFAPMFQSLSNLKDDALLLKALIKKEKEAIIEKKDDLIIIPFNKIDSKLPPALLLYYLLKDFGFPHSETDKIADSVRHKTTGKHFFSETHELLIDRDAIIIRDKKEVTDNKYHIRQNDTIIKKPFSADIKIIPKKEINFSALKDATNAFLDFEKLTFPLTLRRWQKGDRFHPYGMSGSKLLSDYFIDLKLTLYEKENIWLLLSNNQIVWVVGHRISEMFKVSADTDKVFCIKIHK